MMLFTIICISSLRNIEPESMLKICPDVMLMKLECRVLKLVSLCVPQLALTKVESSVMGLPFMKTSYVETSGNNCNTVEQTIVSFCSITFKTRFVVIIYLFSFLDNAYTICVSFCACVRVCLCIFYICMYMYIYRECPCFNLRDVFIRVIL